jgi:hypothetical protein
MPPAMDGSPKVIANDLKSHFIEICRVNVRKLVLMLVNAMRKDFK